MVRQNKGSLLYKEGIGEDIERYLSFIERYIIASGRPLKVVLHRGGSCQEYPKSLHGKAFRIGQKRIKMKNVAELLDFGFREVKADGIEIDVRTVPMSGFLKESYVVHDAVKEGRLSEDTKKYLVNNSLYNVLTHFIAKDYSDETGAESKELAVYIELKVPKRVLRLTHPPLTEAQKEYISQVVLDTVRAIQPPGVSKGRHKAVPKRIAYLSFNFNALEFARKVSMTKGKADAKYFFIAGTNRGLIGRLVALLFFRDISYMTSSQINRMREAEWLTGVWYDPSGIKNMADTFNCLSRGRKFPLEIYVSTYKLNEKHFRKRFEKEAHSSNKKSHVSKLKNVRGLIFDIRKLN